MLLCHGPADSDELAILEAGVDEHVDVWTPALHTTSRFELTSAISNADDAVSDVAVWFTDSVATPSCAFLSWLATGRFAQPAILDDDHLLEPTGAVLRLAGAITLSFATSGRAERIRCYYDRIGLLEQMLVRSPARRTG